jgi:hypothetical protein
MNSLFWVFASFLVFLIYKLIFRQELRSSDFKSSVDGPTYFVAGIGLSLVYYFIRKRFNL